MTKIFHSLGKEVRLSFRKVSTPLGEMVAIGDDTQLWYVGFTDLFARISHLAPFLQTQETNDPTLPVTSVQTELQQYFEGALTSFQTPCRKWGTAFQQKSQEVLSCIPFGSTWSYIQQAEACGHPKAYRAVAQANKSNPFLIVKPCHRVINQSGALGGYHSGLIRKQWLLVHEKRMTSSQAPPLISLE